MLGVFSSREKYKTVNLEQKEWRKLLAVIEHLNNSLDDQDIRENTGRELLDLLSADHFASYIWNSGEKKFTNPVFICRRII